MWSIFRPSTTKPIQSGPDPRRGSRNLYVGRSARTCRRPQSRRPTRQRSSRTSLRRPFRSPSVSTIQQIPDLDRSPDRRAARRRHHGRSGRRRIRRQQRRRSRIATIAIGDPDGGSAVAVQKGDAALLATVNAVIADLIANRHDQHDRRSRDSRSTNRPPSKMDFSISSLNGRYVRDPPTGDSS
ncbi:MAG: hypothetical protein MZU97_13765 [Bacillus subtilis]|nr:hypothetical protein [Bacillus subtilis]